MRSGCAAASSTPRACRTSMSCSATNQVGLDGTIDPCAGDRSGPHARRMREHGRDRSLSTATSRRTRPRSTTASSAATRPGTRRRGHAVVRHRVPPGLRAGPAREPRLVLDQDRRSRSRIRTRTSRCCSAPSPVMPTLCGKVNRDRQRLALRNERWLRDRHAGEHRLDRNQRRRHRRELRRSTSATPASCALRMVGTYLDSYEVTPQPGSRTTASVCTAASAPAARRTARRWPSGATRRYRPGRTPWSGIDLSLGWRYYGEAKRDLESAAGITGVPRLRRREPFATDSGAGFAQLHRPVGVGLADGEVHDPHRREQPVRQGSAAQRLEHLPDRSLQRQHVAAGLRRPRSSGVPHDRRRVLIGSFARRASSERKRRASSPPFFFASWEASLGRMADIVPFFAVPFAFSRHPDPARAQPGATRAVPRESRRRARRMRIRDPSRSATRPCSRAASTCFAGPRARPAAQGVLLARDAQRAVRAQSLRRAPCARSCSSTTMPGSTSRAAADSSRCTIIPNASWSGVYCVDAGPDASADKRGGALTFVNPTLSVERCTSTPAMPGFRARSRAARHAAHGAGPAGAVSFVGPARGAAVRRRRRAHHRRVQLLVRAQGAATRQSTRRTLADRPLGTII